MGYDFSKGITGSNLGKQLLGGLAGAGLGYALAPKAPTYQAPTAAQLDAAIIPEMQNAANLRQAHLLGAQGAKGGRSSSDTLESAQLNQELARGIGSQQALNQIQAANYANYAAGLQNQATQQRYRDIIGAGITGAGFAPQTPSTTQQLQNQYYQMLIKKLSGNQQDNGVPYAGLT